MAHTGSLWPHFAKSHNLGQMDKLYFAKIISMCLDRMNQDVAMIRNIQHCHNKDIESIKYIFPNLFAT